MKIDSTYQCKDTLVKNNKLCLLHTIKGYRYSVHPNKFKREHVLPTMYGHVSLFQFLMFPVREGLLVSSWICFHIWSWAQFQICNFLLLKYRVLKFFRLLGFFLVKKKLFIFLIKFCCTVISQGFIRIFLHDHHVSIWKHMFLDVI